MFVCLAHGSDTARNRLQKWRHQAWPDASLVEDEHYLLITDGRVAARVHRCGSTVGSIDGLVWSDGGAAASELIASLADSCWPLPGHLDGSFSAVAVQPDGQVSVALDPIGVRRVFFGRTSEGFGVSSLQVPLAAALQLKPDLVAVSQLLGSEHTVGRRTLFSGLSEALPGELWRINSDTEHLVAQEPAIVDDGECPTDLATTATALADQLVATATAMLSTSERPGIALSGGLDSRIVLAALTRAGHTPRAFAWGGPKEYETSIIKRCAAAVGSELAFLDLETSLFPPEELTRSWALQTEALLHPAWMGLSELYAGDGCDTVSLGNVTDSYQVRIAGLWGRRARATRSLRRGIGLSIRDLATEPGYRSPDEWWDGFRDRLATRAVRASRRYHIDASPESIVEQTSADVAEWRSHVERSDITSAPRVEDAVHVLICRQIHATQPQAVSFPATGIDLTATRNLGRAALAVSPLVRADRALIQEIARSILPKSLAQIPTATIPFVPATSPAAVQAGVWGARYVADQMLRRVNVLAGGRTGHDRLMPTLDLYEAYRQAGRDHYLASPWARSGTFDSTPFVDEFRAIIDGTGVKPMYPFLMHLAVRIDTMLSWDRDCQQEGSSRMPQTNSGE